MATQPLRTASYLDGQILTTPVGQIALPSQGDNLLVVGLNEGAPVRAKVVRPELMMLLAEENVATHTLPAHHDVVIELEKDSRLVRHQDPWVRVQDPAEQGRA